jgi:hypothetical protein
MPALPRRLALLAAGTITVWQYAVGPAADGSSQMQPRARIALLRSEAMRIEPHAAAHPVVAPADRAPDGGATHHRPSLAALARTR